jgi:hypothetical protein
MNSKGWNYRRQNIAMAIFTPSIVFWLAVSASTEHITHSARIGVVTALATWLTVGPLAYMVARSRRIQIFPVAQSHFWWLMLGGFGTLAAIIAVRMDRGNNLSVRSRPKVPC